jgi:sulfatase maturation enzyme AslB (radical SAM superfamily)
MRNKPILPFVETMITQSCNLSCHGCTNYSDLIHSGYVTWADGRKQLESWLNRVDISDFGILGGEPLVNPEVAKWIVGLRELMPSAQIRFTTNGINLHKKFHLIGLLHDIGNCVIKISHHTDDPRLTEVIHQIYESYDWKPITEYGIDRWTTGDRVRFHVKKPEIFLKTYRGSYADMMPHDNNPIEAFDACIQQTCPLLYNGRIYKCSTAGLLTDLLNRFDRPNWNQWQSLIDPGIGPDCSDADLAGFLDNFGKSHNICRQCPTINDNHSKIDHLKFVEFKKK